MEFLKMDSIINKVKKSIKADTSVTLYILTDDDPDNISYIRSITKINDNEKFLKAIVPINVNKKSEIKTLINKCNTNDKIYIMTSVGDHKATKDIIENFGDLCYSERLEGVNKIYPTPLAILDTILHEYGKDLKGINVVLANRSEVIGKPLINMLLDKNASVSIVHTKTNQATQEMLFNFANIIITAAGKPNSFKTVGPAQQLIVDAGINVVDGKVCGDWNYKDIEYKSDLTITPNPGGIGKLTTYELFKELLK